MMQAYFQTNRAVYNHEGSQDLSHTFQRGPSLLASWTLKSMRFRRCGLGKRTCRSLTMPQQVPWRASSFSGWCLPLNCPKIMELKGIPSPKALHWQVGLSFCLWCRKDGKNEGTVVNHLQTSHYCLGLICSWCLKYFMTSANTMWCHSLLCKQTSAGMDSNNDQEEESNSDNNGEGNFAFR